MGLSGNNYSRGHPLIWLKQGCAAEHDMVVGVYSFYQRIYIPFSVLNRESFWT